MRVRVRVQLAVCRHYVLYPPKSYCLEMGSVVDYDLKKFSLTSLNCQIRLNDLSHSILDAVPSLRQVHEVSKHTLRLATITRMFAHPTDINTMNTLHSEMGSYQAG